MKNNFIIFLSVIGMFLFVLGFRPVLTPERVSTVMIQTIPAEIKYLTFGLAANATPTAPIITAALLTDAQVTWTAPDLSTTNSKTPAASFFTSAGQYSLTVTDWSKVTAFTFQQNAERTFLTNFNLNSVGSLMTGLTKINQAFFYNAGVIPGFGTNIIPASVTGGANAGLYSSFWLCQNVTNTPDVSLCVGATSLYQTWAYCGKLTTTPNIATLTNVTDMAYAFYSCSSLRDMPNLSNFSKVTTYNDTFTDCTNMVGDLSSVHWHSTLTRWHSIHSQIGYTNRGGFLNSANVNAAFVLQMGNSKMPSADVTQILLDLDASGKSNGYLTLAGATAGWQNEAPSAAGYAAKTNLISKGWTVTTN